MCSHPQRLATPQAPGSPWRSTARLLLSDHFMRALPSRLVLGLVLLAGTRTAAAEDWLPFEQDGIAMEVDRDSLSNGQGTWRMAKGGLERTLARIGARASAMDRQVRDIDLPAEVTGAPARLFAEASAIARAMGPSLRFTSPPSLGTTLDTFAFHDGAQHVRMVVSEPTSESLAPMATLTISKRVAGKWVPERQTHVQIDVEHRVSYSVDRHDSSGRRVPETYRQYHPMKRRGQWFGIESDGGRIRHVLRTRDQRSGKLTTSVVRGTEARRLQVLATGRAYRTDLPAAHPDFAPGVLTTDDIAVETLRRAGVHVVVDQSGRVRLRRSPRGVDRAALHQRGITYVAPSRGRAAHLRHRPIKAAKR
jgi:hypothetical protein